MAGEPRRVMIQCPALTRPVFTGRIATAAELQHFSMVDNAVGCEACGDLHPWVLADAWLEDSPLPMAANIEHHTQSLLRVVSPDGIEPSTS